jgi:hypothetical protein
MIYWFAKFYQQREMKAAAVENGFDSMYSLLTNLSM